MGWKTDWLYGLIFAEIRRIWDRARRDAARSPDLMGSAPDSFVIRQFAAGDVACSHCLPPLQRQWIYRGDDVFVPFTADADTETDVEPVRRGAFYATGTVAFHIAADRKAIIFVYGLGPRYGQAWAYRVVGQGQRAHLAEAEGCTGWIA